MGRDHSSGGQHAVSTSSHTQKSHLWHGWFCGRSLTDELERQVFVAARLFGVFVEKHDSASNAAVLQRLLAHAGQLRRPNTQ